MADPDFQGVRVGVKYSNRGELISEGRLENPTSVLTTIRAGYLEAMRNQQIDSSVTATIVTREVEDYEDLRGRLTKADLASDRYNLAFRVLIQEQLLFRLDKTGVLSREQKIQLAKKYPSLNLWAPESMPVPTTAPESLLPTPKVAPTIERLPPRPVSEKKLPHSTQQSVKEVQQPRSQTEEPLLGLDWQDLLVAQAEEWGKLGHQVRSGAHELGKKGAEVSLQMGEKVKAVVGEINRRRAEVTDELAWQLSRRLKAMDPRPIIERTLRNPRVHRAALLGLLVSGSSGFKVEDKNIFAILATEMGNVPPAAASISKEMASRLIQIRSEFSALSEQITIATGELAAQMPTFEAQVRTAWESAASRLPTPIATALPQRVEKAIPQPPATPEVSQLAPAQEVAPVLTEAQLLERFRTAEVPESPPGMVLVPTPAESEYSKYVIPGYKSQTGSPYMKGLDYGQFPWAGVGDVNNPEDVDRIPADAHAKNIRTVITGDNDIPRLKTIVETAHRKGISVAVQFSIPELPKDKIKFTATIDRILSEASPDWLQFENEMGWLDKDGKPNQYYSGSHESIYKEYPAYVKIMQDEMKKSGSKTKLVIGSLGWDFFAHNAELDQFIKGLNSQGVDLDRAYFDIHVFDHLDGDWSSQANIARYREMAKLNGVKDPKFVSLEMYIGSDAPQTPEYIARAFDVYKNKFGIDLLIAYPVTGDWMK